MPNVKLSDEAKAVLRSSTITDRSVTLPQQLERGLYVEIDKVLRNAGGRWNRGAKAHVFERDPRELLREALDNGTSIDQRKKFQAFFTPPELADELAVLAAVEGQTVLEPSAGEGAIVRACRKFGARHVACFEIQPHLSEALNNEGHSCLCLDFLLASPNIGPKYDRVVMNPPFTENQDIKHVEHALKFLKPGGRLVSVICGNFERPKLVKLLEENGGTLKHLEHGVFDESGTGVRTGIITLRKDESVPREDDEWRAEGRQQQLNLS